jgi:hypothetical protein
VSIQKYCSKQGQRHYYDLEILHEFAAIQAKAKAYDQIIKDAAGDK